MGNCCSTPNSNYLEGTSLSKDEISKNQQISEFSLKYEKVSKRVVECYQKISKLC